MLEDLTSIGDPPPDLRMPEGADRDALLGFWRGPNVAVPDMPAHQLIAEVAAVHRDRIAVQCGEEALTYGELDARSSQLGHHLRELGVGPDVLVGICHERSVSLLTALLGVMKAGGAYVPIDPAYPAARQRFMLDDAEAPVLITAQALRPSLPSGPHTTVCLDTDWPSISQHPATAPETTHSVDQLAYVIYTSGSTGIPKGVEVTHRSLVNLLMTLREHPRMTPEDTLLGVTSVSFDAAAVDLFPPLLCGARLVLADERTMADPGLLTDLLERSETTVFNATPSRWRVLLDHGWPGRPGLKAICGGEALPPQLAERMLGLGFDIVNQYGPTEATVCTTLARLREPGAPVTIGRPIGNVAVYILDDEQNPAPIGVAGEVWIAGAGVARGYRNQPELTAQRFVADPFVPGTRMYRSGDLARYRPDGMMEFLGRVDDQVKVRGYRVELGEVEAVLASHPGVADAVVSVLGDGAETQLVGYLVARENGEPSPADLREHTLRRLPEYMVPSAYVSMKAFPQTPNGKVDRKALPPPGASDRVAATYVAPGTELERGLAGLWQRLLGITEVGIDDDFFLLGGNSLLAVQLAHLVEAELGKTCTIAMVLRNTTVRRLAAELQAGGVRATESVVLELAHGTGPALFCLAGVHIYQRLAERLAPQFSTYGIFLPVEQEMFSTRSHRLHLSMDTLAEGYLQVIRKHQPTGPYRLLGFCFGGIVAYEVARQLREAGEEVEVVVMIDSVSPALREPRAQAYARLARMTLDRFAERLPPGLQRWWRGEEWMAEERRLDRARGRIYDAIGRHYRPPRYAGRAVLFLPDEAAAGDSAPTDNTWGWAKIAPNLTVCRVGGAHTTWLEPPHVDAFATALRAELYRPADSPHSGATLTPLPPAARMPM